MTLQLRRKHPITVQKFPVKTAAKRRLLSLVVALTLGLGSSYTFAAEPGSVGTSGAAKRPNLTSALPWRSPGVAPTPVAIEATAAAQPVAAPVTTTMAPRTELRPTAPPALRPISSAPSIQSAPPQTTMSVVPASLNAPANSLRMGTPTIQRTAYQQTPGASGTPRPIAPPPQSDIIQGTTPQPPRLDIGNGLALPPESSSSQAPGLTLPPTNTEPSIIQPPSPSTPAPSTPAPAPSTDGPRMEAPVTPSIPESISPPVEPAPTPVAPPEIAPPLSSPSDRSGTQEPNRFRNPFEREPTPPSSTEPDLSPTPPRPEQERDDLTQPQPTPIPMEAGRNQLSCDDIRARVGQRAIEKISLDISPRFRPDIIDEARLEKTRQEFLKRQPNRVWRDLQGRSLAEGSLYDLEYDQVVLKGRSGQLERIPMSALSEPDLAFVNEQWGLPRACRVEQAPYEGRNWTPMTFVWKASGNCHKPLYFEEVQLERYGHSTGPFLQPVLSSAHFFVNIAVLPYKMGIHPLGECQYALGYYRPGNCAPWMIPPIPLSLRGAIAETAVVGGGIALIP